MIGSSAVLSSLEPRLRNRKCCGSPTINLEAEPSWQLPFFPLYVFFFLSPECSVFSFFFCFVSSWLRRIKKDWQSGRSTQHYLRSCLPSDRHLDVCLCVDFFFSKVGICLFDSQAFFSGRKIKPQCKVNRFNLVAPKTINFFFSFYCFHADWFHSARIIAIDFYWSLK